MHQARVAVEDQRLEYEEAEKRRKAEEDARDLARLKDEARAEVHALETKYGDGNAARSEGRAVVGRAEAARQRHRNAASRWNASRLRRRASP